ncbi:perlucin-like isoform X1 [Mercenaria mercenaria]|uniref:perlucin-like isoform X1 n=1 Tax=Mercenaria mercenaria TaxID=6596 RepID=UPI00234E8DF0|nr:perlucin-like isoform X1 [Mercenaria mercenaria]
MTEIRLAVVLLYFYYCVGQEQQCSRYHYEEQILAKVVKLEHRLELLEARNSIGGQTANSICPDTWIRFRGSCYLFPRGDVNFSAAEYFCVQHGSHIVHVESESENNFLKNHMRDLKESSYWIGLTDTDVEGTWVWSGTGKYALFTDWSSHSPNNYDGNQHCVFMEFAHDFEWNDMTCNAKYRAVCEKNLLS